jgi:5,10-methylenetetrahydromethanopterin reductase
MAARFSLLLNAEHEHRRLIAIARQAEELGFHTLWYADERFYRETYIGLAACALATSRLGLGPAVTDPFTRHPALTAAAIASLDELSGARAVLGYGAGLSGFHNLGLRHRRPALALREAIHVIRRLWSGERVTFEGAVIFIRDGRLNFPARAGIPIYLAADGPHTLRLAGEAADGVILSHCASPLILKSKLERMREGRKMAGRTLGPAVVARLDASVSRDERAALHQAKVRLARLLWAQYPNILYLGPHRLTLPEELDRRLREAGPFQRTHDLAAFRRFADAIPDELVFPIALAGTPEQVARQAAAVIETGADEIMAYLLVPEGETMESVMELFAEAMRRGEGEPLPARAE